MEYRLLGKTGLKISRMGFGGIPIQKTSAEATKSLLVYLKEQGVNYIDTARGYTVSEEYIGYAIEGIREHFVLATKSMARTKEAMERDIDISLKNLRTDYIDLYQVHNPGAADLEKVCAPGGALEALQEAVKAGKIGHIGITLHSLDVFKKVLEYDWVESVMYPYNIVENQGEDTIAKCAEKNIGFIAMKPLAGGALEDATLAMRFICANPNVSVVIPGMAEEKELNQNLAAANDPAPLTAEELAAMEKIRTELGNNFCRRCGYCAPCTSGIGIPAALIAEGYSLRYGLQSYAEQRYAASGAPASSCVDCGLCEERCPYHLPIRQMLKRVVQTFGK